MQAINRSIEEATTEFELVRLKSQCKLVLDVKEKLSIIINPEVTHPPLPTNNKDTSRIGVFKRNVSHAFEVIEIDLNYLQTVVSDCRKYQQLMGVGKTLREIKTLIEETKI